MTLLETFPNNERTSLTAFITGIKFQGRQNDEFIDSTDDLNLSGFTTLTTKHLLEHQNSH